MGIQILVLSALLASANEHKSSALVSSTLLSSQHPDSKQRNKMKPMDLPSKTVKFPLPLGRGYLRFHIQGFWLVV